MSLDIGLLASQLVCKNPFMQIESLLHHYHHIIIIIILVILRRIMGHLPCATIGPYFWPVLTSISLLRSVSGP
jgi:hypothetical protein